MIQSFKRQILSVSSALALGAATISVAQAALEDAAKEAQTEGVFQLLFDQANFWQSRGRGDLARTALSRILETDPTNVDALYQLGLLYLNEANFEDAKSLRKRLFQIPGAEQKADLLDDEIRNRQVNADVLEKARTLAKAGKTEEAVLSYERVFEGRDIAGLIGIEYYETLAGIETRWDEARDGLKAMTNAQPEFAEARLAYAKVLSYRPETRSQSLQLFVDMMADQDSLLAGRQQQNLESMRSALMWLDAKPADVGYYNRYLEYRGADTEVRRKMQGSLSKLDPNSIDGRRYTAFTALERGRLKPAYQAFRAILREKPNDGEALAGLGIVRLRQQRFDKAVDLLEQAFRADRSLRKSYGSALSAAKFWQGHNSGIEAIERSDYGAAQRTLAALEPSNPDENRQKTLALARLERVRGNTDGAIDLYQRVAMQSPGDAAAMQALADLYIQTENYPGLARLQRDFALSGASQHAKATQARIAAHLAIYNRRPDVAETQFAKALHADPENPWLRLEYARHLDKSGKYRQADALMEPALKAPGTSQGTALVAAYHYADRRRWDLSVDVLSALPKKARNETVVAVILEMELLRDVDAAVQRGLLGQSDIAQTQLLNLYESGPEIPSKAPVIVAAFQKLEMDRQAERLVKLVMASGVTLDSQVQLGFIRFLIGNGDLRLARVAMSRLEDQTLSARERNSLADVRDDLQLQEGLVALADGRYRVAETALLGLYDVKPNNPNILRAVGQLRQATGDYEESLSLYRAALVMDSRDLWALRGAVGAALDMDDIRAASALLDTALDDMPNEPVVYELIADTARKSGDVRTAISALEAAKNLQSDAQFIQQSNSVSDRNPGSNVRVKLVGAVFKDSADGYQGTGLVIAPPLNATQPFEVIKASSQTQSQPAAAAQTYRLLSQDGLASELEKEMAAAQRAAELAKPEIERSQQNSTLQIAGLPTTIDTASLIGLAGLLEQQGRLLQAESLLVGLNELRLSADDQSRLNAITYNVMLHLAGQSLNAGDTKTAAQRLSLLSKNFAKDKAVLLLIGRFAESTGRPSTAVEVYQDVLKRFPNETAAVVGASANLLALGRIEDAGRLLASADALHNSKPAYQFMRGKLARARNDNAGAIEAFQQAQHLQALQPARIETAAKILQQQDVPSKPVSTPAVRVQAVAPVRAKTPAPSSIRDDLDSYSPAAGTSRASASKSPIYMAQLDEQAQTAQRDPQENIRERLRRLGTPAQAKQPANTPPALRTAQTDQIDSEISALRAEVQPFTAGGFGFRYRSGDEGLAQLFEANAPLEFNFNPAIGRFGIQIEPVFLSAGDFGSDPFTTRFLGTLALVEAEDRGTPNEDTAGGVGIRFSYDSDYFDFYVGTTPLGFEVLNIIGGLGFEYAFDSGFAIELDVNRDPITDSILSWAGLSDPVNGTEFGGVTGNKARLQLAQDYGNFGIYLNGTFGVYDGRNIDSNDYVEGNSGFYLKFGQNTDRTLSLGFNIGYFSFEENRRYFTLGHGGYFSPQDFLSATFPVNYTLQTQKLSLDVGASIGVQHFTEDAVAFFPGSPTLQQQLEAFELDQPNFYEENSVTSLAASGRVNVQYDVSPELSVIGQLSIDRSADWTESTGLISLRYQFGGNFGPGN